MHQCLIQWHRDDVELVHANDSVSIAIANPMYWEQEDFECFLASDAKEASLRSMMKNVVSKLLLPIVNSTFIAPRSWMYYPRNA